LEPFSRDKLFLSLYESCEHRKTALGDARGLAETIISKLSAHLVDGAVTSGEITRVAQVALNRFDKAASTHYRAFHTSKT
jgi:transcriptional regulator NrdR family protein